MSLSAVVNGPDFSSLAGETVEGSPTETKKKKTKQRKKAAVNKKCTTDFNSSIYYTIYNRHFLMFAKLPKWFSVLSCMIYLPKDVTNLSSNIH